MRKIIIQIRKITAREAREKIELIYGDFLIQYASQPNVSSEFFAKRLLQSMASLKGISVLDKSQAVSARLNSCKAVFFGALRAAYRSHNGRNVALAERKALDESYDSAIDAIQKDASFEPRAIRRRHSCSF